MRMALKNKAWKANATLLAVCAGLAGVMCGCGDDTVGGTSGEGPTTDASATDAPVDSTTTTPDTGATPDTGTTVVDATTDSSSAPDTGTTVVDSSTPDTGIVDSSTAETSVKDTGAADVAVTDATSDAADAAQETLCQLFNSEYLFPDGGAISPDVGQSWAIEIIDGPAS